MIEEGQTTPTAAEARAHLLAKVSNDHLLKVREAVDRLYTNLDSSFWYSFEHKSPIRTQRESLLDEVKGFKRAIEEEYAHRLLRGSRWELQKLIAELQPQVPTVAGRLIPINAAAAADVEQEDKKQEAVQTMSALVEQFRTALASFSISDAESSDAESTAQGIDTADEEEEDR